MGRPKKADMDPVPTRERLLRKALELFATKGFDAVSVKQITKSLGLTEGTLYIHYENKAALLEAIFARLEQKLLTPAFVSPPAAMFQGDGPLDLVEFLLAGAKHFFSKTDQETMLTWRLLMISQYRHAAAQRSVRDQLLAAPCDFFAGMLASMKEAGRIRPNTDTASVGRIIAAIFFQYSFGANLDAAWECHHGDAFEQLAEDLAFVAEGLALDP
jgi:AcrR family transcriptional regulator